MTLMSGIKATIARQFTKWDGLSSILSYYVKALGTYYHNIVGTFATYLYRNTRDIAFLPAWCVDDISPTPSTRFSHAVCVTLPVFSHTLSSRTKTELHGSSPHSHYVWKQLGVLSYYQLYEGETKTGIAINMRDSLWLLGKGFKLKHPIFHIVFFLQNRSHIQIDLIDVSILEEAKSLAEAYWTEWLRVKDNPKYSQRYFKLLGQ